MRQTISRASFTLGATAVRAICSLVITKLLAEHYGTLGMVFLSQFLAVTAFMHAVPFDGVLRAYVKEAALQNDSDRRKKLQVALTVNIALVLATLPILFFYTSLTDYGLGMKLILAFSFVAAMIMFVAFFTSISIWQLEMKVKNYAFANVCSTLAGLGGVLISIWLHISLPWILVIWLFCQSIPIAFTIANFKEILKPKIISVFYWNERSEYLNLLKIGLTIASISIIGRGADVATRTMVLGILGETNTGLWQALSRISDVYIVPLNALLGMMFYPQAAALVQDLERLKLLVRQWILLIVGLSIPSLFILFYIKQWVLVIVMSESFLPAGEWMQWQLMGDSFKILSYILASLAIVLSRNKQLIAIEILSSILLIFGSYFMAELYGGIGLTQLHFIRYLLYCLYWVYNFRTILFNRVVILK